MSCVNYFFFLDCGCGVYCISFVCVWRKLSVFIFSPQVVSLRWIVYGGFVVVFLFVFFIYCLFVASFGISLRLFFSVSQLINYVLFFCCF